MKNKVMTPQEKAKELLWKYLPILEGWKYEDSNTAKKCALIVVDEIMKAVGWGKMELGVDRDNYWEEVKQEIENL
jgi:hypothetical protein